MPRSRPQDRIAELEDELKQRDTRIKELVADLDKAEALISQQRGWMEDRNALLDSWIEGFEMVQGEDGKWMWGPFIDRHNELVDKYNALVREWNWFADDYNAVVRPRNVGRPLAASDAQRATVLALRKRGLSYRSIAEETNLGLRTVRTIVEQKEGRDRTTRKHLERIYPDRKRDAAWRARKRVRDGLPKRINETQKRGRELIQAAKGLR
jgi:lambda repressor-like predicted transcriptional regulator